MGIDTIINK